jgi:hypothetical protein
MIDVLKFKENGIIKKEVVLTNKVTGEKRRYLLRPFLPGDEEGMIACVKEEHKNTYFKKFFYDPLLLREKAKGKEYVFFVAEEVSESKVQKSLEKRIAGIELLRLFQENGDDYIEPASQMIRKRHRGFGLSGALVEYTFFVAKELKPAALFVHTAMYHNITQHVCESYGMVPVGYEIGSFLTEVMENSFTLEGIKKYSAGTLCSPVEKKEAPTVYLPKELVDYGTMVYSNLGVNCRISENTDGNKTNSSQELSSVLVSEENIGNRYITIDVRKAGEDLLNVVRKIMEQRVKLKDCNPDAWVYHLVLNTDTNEFSFWYDKLKEIGFFFGGLQPLCGRHERAFLYWVGDLQLHMEEYVVTDRFNEIRNCIMHFYNNRTKQ